MITTKGQENVLKNLEEKSRKSMAMFDSMVNEINNSLIVKTNSAQHVPRSRHGYNQSEIDRNLCDVQWRLY